MLCLYGAAFASTKPESNEVVLVEDPRPGKAAPRTITVETAKDKPVVKLEGKEGESLTPPGEKAPAVKPAKAAPATPVKVVVPLEKPLSKKAVPEKKTPAKPAEKSQPVTSTPKPAAKADAKSVAAKNNISKPATPKVNIPQAKPTQGQQAQASTVKSDMKPREMHEMVMKLQMYNSELMQELQKGRQQNYKLIRALRESRKHSSDLQIKLNKQELELEIKKLREGGKVEAEAPADQLARQNKIMKLQLELMNIDQPKRYAGMLEKVSQLSAEKDKVWANNRRLNELLSKQTNISEQRQEEINVIRPKLLQSEKEIARLRMEIKQLKASLTNPTPVKSVVVSRPANTASASPEKPAPKPVTAVSDSRLIGKIISIDDQIIKINIGSLKGLQAGMRLIVYRRDKFVGYMRVDIVGETTAAGSMSREILVPQAGDNVTDRL